MAGGGVGDELGLDAVVAEGVKKLVGLRHRHAFIGIMDQRASSSRPWCQAGKRSILDIVFFLTPAS
jgi:hypothetical protein